MQKPKSKASIRDDLNKEIEAFLNKGGEINDIQQGVSGKEIGDNINNAIPLNHEKQTRTLLTDEVNALDARKHDKKQTSPKPESRQPKKRIIYDDFGEPIREIWE